MKKKQLNGWMRRVVFGCFFGMLSVAGQVCAATPTFVWIEGENPTSKNFEFKTDEFALLSGGVRLLHTIPMKVVGEEMPEEGYLLTYSFDVADAGQHEAWMRIGFESLRAPIDWRVDGGEWKTIASDIWVTSLMDPKGFSSCGWIQDGEIALSKGKHTLEIRITEASPTYPRSMMFQLDCVTFVKGKFNPEGKLKPGESYDEQVDKDAAAMVFGSDDKTWSKRMGRDELELTGLWQVARWDDPDMDKDTFEAVKKHPSELGRPLSWMGVAVPGTVFQAKKGVVDGGRPEMKLGHRFFYRTQVKVPESYKGSAFHLNFEATSWITSVFVNGKRVGDHTTVMVPWNMDITKYLKPGEVNEIVVGFKSAWYSIDNTFINSKMRKKGQTEPAELDKSRNVPSKTHRFTKFLAATFGCSGMNPGLRGKVCLVATGKAQTTDVFIRTSVEKKQLDADVEISNRSDKDVKAEILCEALDDATGKVAKSFPSVTVSVPAWDKAVVQISDAWKNPKLWWPEPNANCYRMRTTIKVGGKVTDVREDTFGFREVTYEGKHCMMNGTRWHFRYWMGGAGKKNSYESWLEQFRGLHQNYIRTFGAGMPKCDKTYEFNDRNGIATFDNTRLNGMYNTKNVDNPIFWENAERHIRQYVKAYRNHPSVLLWVLGNEFLLINNAQMAGINNANFVAESKKRKKKKLPALERPEYYENYEDLSMKLIEIQRELDPTRRATYDGSGDIGGKNNVNCNHYGWLYGVGFPESQYTYRIGDPIYPRSSSQGRWQTYLWNGKTPLIFGEVMFYTLGNPDMGWIGGPDAYQGVKQQDIAGGKYAKIAIEGARWQDTMATCPWSRPLPGAINSYKPRAVFIREHNRCFFSGAPFKRTIKVFNDGRKTDPLTLKWSIVLDGKKAVSGEKTYTIKPGYNQEDTITATLPNVTQRADGELVMELYAKDELVYDEKRLVSILPQATLATITDAKKLCVFDPNGKVSKWLDAHGGKYTTVTDVTKLPSTAKILLVGDSAFAGVTKGNKKTERLRIDEASASAIRDFVAAGNIAIVLEQDAMLIQNDLPIPGIDVAANQVAEVPGWGEFDTAAKGRNGSIAHPAAPSHPVLNGLTGADFFTWGGGEFNYRKSYATPESGAICIIQSGHNLSLTPLMDIPVGTGRYLLSQMLIAENLDADPIAGELLVNALAWATSLSSAEPGKTVVALGDDPFLQKAIDDANINYTSAKTVADVFKDNDVAIIRADAKNMKWIAENIAAVRSFCEKGGWAMLSGVAPSELSAFNKLVGFEHKIRPFRMEKAVISNRADPLMMGVFDKNFSQSDPTYMIAPWVHKYAVSKKIFKHVVDGKDIAAFSKFLDPNHERVANGLTNADMFKYICYMKLPGSNYDGEDLKDRVYFRYDTPETFNKMYVWGCKSYMFMDEVELIFDGDKENSLKFNLRQTTDRQELEFEPRKAKEVLFVINSVSSNPDTVREIEITGLDMIQLLRYSPELEEGKIIPLTNPAGLVKYPMGKGGILLNQLDYDEPLVDGKKIRKIGLTHSELNIKKKQSITSNILRNLGCSLRVTDGEK